MLQRLRSAWKVLTCDHAATVLTIYQRHEHQWCALCYLVLYDGTLRLESAIYLDDDHDLDAGPIGQAL
jgi:hypothetical protein